MLTKQGPKWVFRSLPASANKSCRAPGPERNNDIKTWSSSGLVSPTQRVAARFGAEHGILVGWYLPEQSRNINMQRKTGEPNGHEGATPFATRSMSAGMTPVGPCRLPHSR